MSKHFYHYEQQAEVATSGVGETVAPQPHAGETRHSLVTVAADGPLEEASAAITGGHAVVLARRLVPTHPARSLPALHLRQETRQVIFRNHLFHYHYCVLMWLVPRHT